MSVTPPKILIMGLSGTGKTTLAKEIAYYFNVPHHNADIYRELNDDWDFSEIGRARQARRMSQQWGILDFICPTKTLRNITDPHFIIWMDTFDWSPHEDTNNIFEFPDYDVRIQTWIGQDQLHKCLEDFNPSIEGMLNFLDVGLRKLVK